MFYSDVLGTYLCCDLIGEMNEYRLGSSYIDEPLGMQVSSLQALKMTLKNFLCLSAWLSVIFAVDVDLCSKFS